MLSSSSYQICRNANLENCVPARAGALVAARAGGGGGAARASFPAVDVAEAWQRAAVQITCFLLEYNCTDSQHSSVRKVF